MMEDNDYNLKWNEYESGVISGIQDIYKSGEFCDVTLICGSNQVKVHRVILSACSPVFRSILNPTLSQTHPVVYLRGVSWESLDATIKFIYSGEVCVSQDRLGDFLATAEDLKVSGLTPSRTGSSPATPSAVKPIKTLPAKNVSQSMTETADSLSMENVRTNKRDPELCEDEGSRKRTKSEDTKSIINQSSQEMPSQKTTDISDKELSNSKKEHNYPLDITETIQEDLNNEIDELDDYYDESFDEYADMENDNNVTELGNGSLISEGEFSNSNTKENFELKTGLEYKSAGVKIKKDRLPVVNFINMNKIKMQTGFMCKFCSRVSQDNSNMNRHIEIKHSKELQQFLKNFSNSPELSEFFQTSSSS